MAYNKFIKNDGTVMLDLTDTTVSSATLGKDITAVDKHGNKIIGTLTGSPIPIEVSTEEEMTALLESGEISSVYKYVGTTGTYENNALYELTSESDPLQGTWVFNDTIDLSNYPYSETSETGMGALLGNAITFKTLEFQDDLQFSYFVCSRAGSAYVYDFGYTNDLPPGAGSPTVYRLDEGWVSDAYKPIEIISTYEELVSLNDETSASNLLSWLQANATKQPSRTFAKLILQSDLEEITITENGEYSGEYSKVSVDVNTFPTYIATKQYPNDFSKLFYYSTINDTQLNTLMNGLDTSGVTDMNNMFYQCENLTTIPFLDTSNVADMNYMFAFCRKLINIPLLNTSNVTNMESIFRGCTNLTTIPFLDTSNVTDMGSMFAGCSNLTSIPQLDTSNVTDMEDMFYGCTNLTTVPFLDTSNVTNIINMFSQCTNLTTIPVLDTSNVSDLDGMFYKCTSLTTVQLIYAHNARDLDGMFNNCTNLTSLNMDFTGNDNLSMDTTNLFKDCINLKSLIMTNMKFDFDISVSTQFETQDLVNLIDSLYDYSASGVSTYAMGPITYATLTMGSTNLAKLTSEQIAVANAKGWALQ